MSLHTAPYTFLSVTLLGIVLLCGCREKMDVSSFESATNSAQSSDQRKAERLFDSAIEALNRLEQDSSEESGNQVTGRLNEWIKTAPNPTDWVPDAMVPEWQKSIQDKLPLFANVAHQIQYARQEISGLYDKIIHLTELQNKLNEYMQMQQAGATDQNIQDEIDKIQTEGKEINDYLISYKMPECVTNLIPALQNIRSILADESIPVYDPWNLAAFDVFVTFVEKLESDGIQMLVQLPPDDLLGMMDKFSSWFNTIAGDYAINELAFPESDIHYLQESIWLRDASQWAQGTSADTLSRVTALFDWTVKNIALESATENRTRPVSEKEPQDWQALRPLWNILLSGRGTVAERAWVFARLAEHQGLDVALVRVPCSCAVEMEEKREARSEKRESVEDGNEAKRNYASDEVGTDSNDSTNLETTNEHSPEANASGSPSLSEDAIPPERLLVAWIDESEIYFFDPEYGLPIPAPNGVTLIGEKRESLEGGNGAKRNYASDEVETDSSKAPSLATRNSQLATNLGLSIVPATLKQILSDSSILDKMSYKKSEDKEVKYYLTSEDFKNLEFYLPVNPLSMSKRMWILQTRLTGDKSARLTSFPSDVKTKLEKLVPNASVTLWTQPYAVPMFCPLRQSEENSYIDAMLNLTYSVTDKPLLRARITYLKGKLKPETEGDDCAVIWYQKSRLSDQQLNKIAPKKQDFYAMSKLFASYWLGLLSDALNNHEAAQEYFQLTVYPNSEQTNTQPHLWTVAALYNTARVDEETGRFEQAIENYQLVEKQGITGVGAGLRAQWLKTATGK